MTEITSKLDDRLLHLIQRCDEIQLGRTDLCPDEQFLQCAALRPEQGQTYKPHKHLWHSFNGDRVAQESWCMIKGNVRVTLYDMDNTIIHVDVLTPGDISITFEGGHTYEILTEGAIIYEFKTGPYFGQEKDKVFI